ncbi:MAG: polysaccharide pyruvyl transferase family protein [Vicinamibacterales bacterium]
MRALLIGHFSTVGDIEVLSQVERQLRASRIDYDIASYSRKVRTEGSGWIGIGDIRPQRYSHLLFVCGPLSRGYLQRTGLDLARFAHCTMVGVNLTMVEPLDAYDPLDVYVGRDSDRWQKPDLSFMEEVKKVPVAGVCLVKRQGEYGSRQMHREAAELLNRLAKRAGLALLDLDTEWPAHRNAVGLASPSQFESLCARCDVVLTNRLHGMVLALKNEVPVVAIDAISGGGKVSRQARVIGWPEVFGIDDVTDSVLDAALARCLALDARQRARKCAEASRQAIGGFPEELASALSTAPGPRRHGADADEETVPRQPFWRLRPVRSALTRVAKRLRTQ